MYIINPWLFYLIGIADSLTTFFMFLGVTLLLGCVIFVIILAPASSVNEYEKKCLKNSVKGAIVGAIFLFISILIPPKDVSYQMLAASLVTKDNIEYATEAGKDIIDYIIESANIILKNEQMSKAEGH